MSIYDLKGFIEKEHLFTFKFQGGFGEGNEPYYLPEELCAAVAGHVYPNFGDLETEVEHDKKLIQGLQDRESTLTTNISKVEAAIQQNRVINQKNVDVLSEQQRQQSEKLKSYETVIQKQKQETSKIEDRVDQYAQTGLHNAKVLESGKKKHSELEDKLQETNSLIVALEDKLHANEESNATYDATISRQECSILELEKMIEALASEHQTRVEQLNRDYGEKCKVYKAEQLKHMKDFIPAQKTVAELSKKVATRAKSLQSTPCSSDVEGF